MSRGRRSGRLAEKQAPDFKESGSTISPHKRGGRHSRLETLRQESLGLDTEDGRKSLRLRNKPLLNLKVSSDSEDIEESPGGDKTWVGTQEDSTESEDAETIPAIDASDLNIDAVSTVDVPLPRYAARRSNTPRRAAKVSVITNALIVYCLY
jgi:hypothetical protein